MFPLNKEKVYITSDSMSFKDRDFVVETEIPIGNHVGAFGAKRRYDIHSGIDLYCPDNEPFYAIEDGKVVIIEDFTGEKANSPWWNDTQAIHIEGKNGVIVYGEITVGLKYQVGDDIREGQRLGRVKRVLKNNKGRPTSMLHIELYKHGNRRTCIWTEDKLDNDNLLDPTELIMSEAVKEMLI